MTNAKTARVLKSAARWLQRRAKDKSSADTKAAYREAIALVNKLRAEGGSHAEK
jgi:hypothetical protein